MIKINHNGFQKRRLQNVSWQRPDCYFSGPVGTMQSVFVSNVRLKAFGLSILSRFHCSAVLLFDNPQVFVGPHKGQTSVENASAKYKDH